MTPVILDLPQRSPAWFQARLGRLTGSRAADMLATIKSGEAAARRNYRIELAVERLTGLPADDTYVTAVMQRGLDMEPLAVSAYEAATGELVRRTGFCQHPTLHAGTSLDGDVGDLTGILEVKCPKSTTHFTTLKGGVIPKDYLPQITHALWITGAQWCDWVSFDDRYPPDLALFIRRVQATDIDLAAYDAIARQFLLEVDQEVDAVRASCAA